MNHQIEVTQAYVDVLDAQATAQAAYDAAAAAASGIDRPGPD
ncbi:MAG: hypothetical protein U1E16_04845 [Hyphomicrobiales bacterium]